MHRAPVWQLFGLFRCYPCRNLLNQIVHRFQIATVLGQETVRPVPAVVGNAVAIVRVVFVPFAFLKVQVTKETSQGIKERLVALPRMLLLRAVMRSNPRRPNAERWESP